jgi:hypothetical protein
MTFLRLALMTLVVCLLSATATHAADRGKKTRPRVGERILMRLVAPTIGFATAYGVSGGSLKAATGAAVGALAVHTAISTGKALWRFAQGPKPSSKPVSPYSPLAPGTGGLPSSWLLGRGLDRDK